MPDGYGGGLNGKVPDPEYGGPASHAAARVRHRKLGRQQQKGLTSKYILK